MNRPYMICHILSALNGKISGDFFGTESAAETGAEYARLRREYRADAWLYGTTTTKEFTQFRRAVLPRTCPAIPAGDYVAEAHAELYYVSIDTQGEIGWESGTFRRNGCPDAHIIEVVTEQTSKAYLDYLRNHGVSYIVAGNNALDCRIAAEKLYRLFHIKKVLICGGGAVNWTFVQQGMVDELSLLIAPVADGNAAAPSVFDRSSFLTDGTPVEFRLKKMEKLGANGVRLVYQK